MTPSHLRLEADPSGRFLPWVIAVMVFLSALALASALIGARAVNQWQGSVEGRLTVQILDRPEEAMPARVGAALRLLRETRGVVTATPLDRTAVEALLVPWLGSENLSPDLPLPALIDVELDPAQPVDVDALARRLESSVAGAKLESPRRWLDRLAALVDLFRLLGIAIVGLIGLATVAMVVFATRAGLAAHRDAIEVLHIVGATDGHVARQFERHVLGLALWGGIPGLLAALAVLYLIGAMAERVGVPLLPALQPDWTIWLAAACLLLATIALAALTARLTVLGNLRRMM